jgi:hypothetical protein
VSCDGARYFTLIPRSKVEYEDGNKSYYRIIYFLEDSIDFLLNKMIQKIYKNQSTQYIDGYILNFKTEEEASLYLSDKNNFFNGPSFYKSPDLKRYKVWEGKKLQMV